MADQQGAGEDEPGCLSSELRQRQKLWPLRGPSEGQECLAGRLPWPPPGPSVRPAWDKSTSRMSLLHIEDVAVMLLIQQVAVLS